LNKIHWEIKRRHGLFWRIYIYGVILLIVVAAAGAGAALLVGASPPWLEAPDRLATLLATKINRDGMGMDEVQERLEEIHHVFQINISVIDQDGERLASAGSTSSATLLTTVELKQISGKTHFRRKLAIPLKLSSGNGGYLVLTWGENRHHLKIIFVFIIIFILLAVMPFFMAGIIAKPLERITQSARAFGKGDLSVRTGVRRKDEIGILAGTFDEMAERLEHFVHSEKELLANISHEIKTPMSRIRVALELCAEEEIDIDSVKSYLSGISKDLAELEKLVENVLMTARLDLSIEQYTESGFVLQKKDMTLAHVVNQAVGRFSEIHPEYHVRINISPDLSPVEADPVLIRRVLDNLLDNAVKYSKPDSPIDIVAVNSEKEQIVHVQDRGMGVPEKDLPRLFEPFFRTDKSRNRNMGGVGLGLTLCKRIIEAHGGTISASPRPEGGTSICFTLPEKK